MVFKVVHNTLLYCMFKFPFFSNFLFDAIIAGWNIMIGSWVLVDPNHVSIQQNIKMARGNKTRNKLRKERKHCSEWALLCLVRARIRRKYNKKVRGEHEMLCLDLTSLNFTLLTQAFAYFMRALPTSTYHCCTGIFRQTNKQKNMSWIGYFSRNFSW